MPVSSHSFRLLTLPGLALVALTGCATSNPCGDDPQYLQARDRPRLEMPEGVSGSERLASGAMVVPPAAPDPARLDPEPKCLDHPPPFFAPEATKPSSVKEPASVEGTPQQP
jgi:hypothetical protein